MELFDFNQILRPPEHAQFTGARPDGAFIRLTYEQKLFETGTPTPYGINRTVIYLNDQGREVCRTTDFETYPTPLIEAYLNRSRVEQQIENSNWYCRFKNSLRRILPWQKKS